MTRKRRKTKKPNDQNNGASAQSAEVASAQTTTTSTKPPPRAPGGTSPGPGTLVTSTKPPSHYKHPVPFHQESLAFGQRTTAQAESKIQSDSATHLNQRPIASIIRTRPSSARVSTEAIIHHKTAPNQDIFASGPRPTIKATTSKSVSGTNKIPDKLDQNWNQTPIQIKPNDEERSGHSPINKARVKDLGTHDILTLLMNNGVSLDEANKLKEEDFNGQMLCRFEKGDYKELGLKMATILLLLKLREELPTGVKMEDSKPKKAKPKEQLLRRFWTPASNTLGYSEGNFIKHEVGSSNILEPSREFKAFTGITKLEDREIEAAFVDKAKPFLIGCLNRRCNGTIYFGVSDEGIITGINVTLKKRALFEDIMDKQIRGKDPMQFRECFRDMKVAVTACVSNVNFVPIEGCEDKVVIEIDVKPSVALCGNIIFYSQPPKGKKMFYLREGTSSQSITVDNKKIKELEGKVFKFNIDRREQEAILLSCENNFEAKLRQLLCRGRNKINDEELKYVLVCNKLEDVQNRFSWLLNINWTIVYDFGIRSREAGFIQAMEQSDKVIRIPTFVTSTQLTDIFKSQEHNILSEFKIGKRTLYVCCDEKAEKDYSKWYRSSSTGISQSFLHVTKSTHMERIENVVVVVLLDSDESTKKIGCILRELFKNIDSSQIMCLYEKVAHGDRLAAEVLDLFGDSWRNQMVRATTWEHVDSFVKERTPRLGQGDLTIVSSGDVNVSIPPTFIDFYQKEGIEILTSNHCSNLELMDSKEFTNMANEKVRSFLKGGRCDWEVFYLSTEADSSCHSGILPGYVKRSVVNDIVKDLTPRNRQSEKCVVRKRIVHSPGAGATTIGRSVLWKMRDKMRCLAINGADFIDGDEINVQKASDVAEHILDFRAYKESDDVISGIDNTTHCKTVLVLLDKANDILAKALTSKIEYHVESRRIIFTYPMIILLYLYSNFDIAGGFGGADLGDEIEASHLEYQTDVYINHSLTEEEKKLFRSRLVALQLRKDEIEVRDMLSFVIMAENFREDSAYVRSVVQSVVTDMEVYPSQKKFLLYLAILKYFGDTNLPWKHCNSFLLSFFASSTLKTARHASGQRGTFIAMDFWDVLVAPAKLFLTQYRVSGSEGVTGSYNVTEVTHMPVAFQLLNALLGGRTLTEVTSELLKEKVILEEPFLRSHLNVTLRKLLVKRATKEHGKSDPRKRDVKKVVFGKEKFSKIITKIKAESFEEAKVLLENGYDALEGKNKSYVAQTLARLYITKEDFDKAEEWAKKAIELFPAFFIIDTLGQVYKNKLKTLIEGEKKKSTSFSLADCKDIISVASMAANEFREAQEVYSRTKTKEATRESNLNEVDVESDSSANQPGLMGEITTNLDITEFLLRSTELSNSDTSVMFKQALRMERTDFEISSLFLGVTSWNWKDYIGFISDLFTRTMTCIQIVTRKLAYVNITLSPSMKYTLSILESCLTQMETVFGNDGAIWRKFIESKKHKPKQKIDFLRRILVTGVTNSFGWLVRRDEYVDSTLRKYQDILVEMITLINSHSTEVSMINDDRLSYVNVAFAIAYFKSDRQRLKWNLITKFTKELVLADMDVPEPYFFFLLLHWPLANANLSEEEVDLLHKCMKKLRDLEDVYVDSTRKSDIYIGPKPRFYFFLKQGEEMDRFLPVSKSLRFNLKHLSHQAVRLEGNLDQQKNVELSLAGGGKLKLRAASLHNRGKFVTRVSFNVGFTLGGPVAYNLESDDKKQEKSKLMKT